MDTAKVFMTGRSQAVRLPKAYQFREDEVYISRIGETVILMPKNTVKDAFWSGIGLATDDFMADGRPADVTDLRGTL